MKLNDGIACTEISRLIDYPLGEKTDGVVLLNCEIQSRFGHFLHRETAVHSRAIATTLDILASKEKELT